MPLNEPKNGRYSTWPGSTGKTRPADMTDDHLANVREFVTTRRKEAVQKVQVYSAWLNVILSEQDFRRELENMDPPEEVIPVLSPDLNFFEAFNYARCDLQTAYFKWRGDVFHTRLAEEEKLDKVIGWEEYDG